MEYRNPIYNRHGTVDCEINHPVLGWVTTTTSPDDEETSGLYGEMVAAGGVAAYIPPTPEEARLNMPPLTARQFRLGLVAAGISPSQVTAAIDAMSAGIEKDKAQIEWEYATTFTRTHALIATVAQVLGLTDEQIDTMWTAALSL
ncbi:MAG: hypothetical protein QMD99_10470 [Rhizobiaceae bacterium]|nr:hypothetical protein [Rhizobiaceae bacterium]